MWEHDYVVFGYSWRDDTLRLYTNEGLVTCWDYLGENIRQLLKDKEQVASYVDGATLVHMRYDHRIHMKYNSEGKIEVTYNGIC